MLTESRGELSDLHSISILRAIRYWRLFCYVPVSPYWQSIVEE